jgi:hypothetical protein
MMVRRGELQRGHGLGVAIGSSEVVLPSGDMMARAARLGHCRYAAPEAVPG